MSVEVSDFVAEDIEGNTPMKHLSKSLCLPILALGGLLLPAIGAVRAAAPVEVPRWEMHEFELHGRCQGENPYAFAHPDGTAFFPMGETSPAERA